MMWGCRVWTSKQELSQSHTSTSHITEYLGVERYKKYSEGSRHTRTWKLLARLWAKQPRTVAPSHYVIMSLSLSYGRKIWHFFSSEIRHSSLVVLGEDNWWDFIIILALLSKLPSKSSHKSQLLFHSNHKPSSARTYLYHSTAGGPRQTIITQPLPLPSQDLSCKYWDECDSERRRPSSHTAYLFLVIHDESID